MVLPKALLPESVEHSKPLSPKEIFESFSATDARGLVSIHALYALTKAQVHSQNLKNQLNDYFKRQQKSIQKDKKLIKILSLVLWQHQYLLIIYLLH